MPFADITVQEHVPLAPFTTFGVGGPARYLVEINVESDIPAALLLAEQHKLPLLVLGGGSNLLIPDEGFNGLVLHIKMTGLAHDKPWDPRFWVAAGEPWDRFVQYAVEHDFAGVECLAGIPGSTGGTPVQNVGAYGQEVSQTITSVRVYDRSTGSFRQMNLDECEFRYRESVFNTTARGRYIVTSVVFDLVRGGEPNIGYADLQKRFANRRHKPNLKEVAEAVREIRHGKGMLLVEGDPDCRSAGSFFKNPVIPFSSLQHIAEGAGVPADAVPRWLTGNGMMKVPAAWLLERAGFVKGYGSGPAGISTRHTLALTNRGGARFADVAALEQEIIRGVHERFDVRLQREPVVPDAAVEVPAASVSAHR